MSLRAFLVSTAKFKLNFVFNAIKNEPRPGTRRLWAKRFSQWERGVKFKIWKTREGLIALAIISKCGDLSNKTNNERKYQVFVVILLKKKEKIYFLTFFKEIKCFWVKLQDNLKNCFNCFIQRLLLWREKRSGARSATDAGFSGDANRAVSLRGDPVYREVRLPCPSKE